MPIKTIVDLWSLLPLTGAGLIFAAFGLGMFLIGWAAGKNRGYAQAPEKVKGEWREEHMKRLIAEGRADTAELTVKRFDAAMQALAHRDVLSEPRQEARGLRVARG